jgi:hypothetical protein
MHLAKGCTLLASHGPIRDFFHYMIEIIQREPPIPPLVKGGNKKEVENDSLKSRHN